MSQYNRLVFLSRDIYGKICLYRQFLEKSEFRTTLDDVRFASMDTAEEFSSAEFANVRECFYLYGLITKQEYCDAVAHMQQQQKENPNPEYFMFFCQEKHPEDGAYDCSRQCDGLKDTYRIGVLEDDENYKALKTEEQRDEIRCLKLLSLIIAVCSRPIFTPFGFEYQYITAVSQLNYQNIYYAILYKLNEYAQSIQQKQKLIETNEDIILSLQQKKPRKCIGKFKDEPEEPLKPFPQDKDMELFSRNMAVLYRHGVDRLQKGIAKDIEVARRALAIADAQTGTVYTFQEDGTTIGIREEAEEFQDYMQVEEAKETEITTPDALLSRPGDASQAMPDATKIHAILPLAGEFAKTEHPKFSKLGAISLGCGGLFVALVCSVYAVRYFRSGLVGISANNLLLTALLPLLAILATALIGFICSLIERSTARNIFKNLYHSIVQFLAMTKDFYSAVREYINKYLTVYYNYHLRFARIERLRDEILVLEQDIEKLEREVHPLNAVAETVYSLSSEEIVLPKEELDEYNHIQRTKTQVILDSIRIDAQTDFSGSQYRPDISVAWIKRLVFGIGNINDAGGNR